MDGLDFKISSGDKSTTLGIKIWMDRIESGEGQDLLAGADGKVDNQVGAFGDKTEYVLGTQTEAPLFEFRDLGASIASKFEEDVVAAEEAIIAYHKQFAATRRARSLFKQGVRVSNGTFNGTIRQPLSACPIQNSTATKTTASKTTPASITPKPTISCELHNEDPDQGINQAFCLCDGSKTLSPLPVAKTGHQSDSCAYTAIPSTAVEVVTTLKETYTSNCQVCTQIQLNAPTCTSQPGCYPTVAVANVTAGSSPVHVGTLTGTKLYSSVSSALNKICPPVTQTTSATACETDGVSIKNIPYVADNSLETDGVLTIKVQVSSYNVTSLRDAMINSAALTAQKSTENMKNCYNQTYETLMRKRDLPLLSFGPRQLWGLAERDRPVLEPEKIELCNAASFAAVNYFNPWWREAPQPGATDFIYADFSFHIGPGGEFVCEFLADLAEGLAVIAPEFTAEDVALGEEIRAICEDLGDM